MSDDIGGLYRLGGTTVARRDKQIFEGTCNFLEGPSTFLEGQATF
jgi:hypothetical protein